MRALLRNLGILCILVAVGLLAYNLSGYHYFYFSDSERGWITIGAVVLAGGIFLYRRGR